MHVRTHCHHRRRPGRTAGGPKPARRRVPGPTHHGGGRGLSALSAAATVQGLSAGHLRARAAVPQRRRLLSRGGVRASAQYTRHGDRPCGKDGYAERWPHSVIRQAAAGDGNAGEKAQMSWGRTCRAFIICATSPMWTGCRTRSNRARASPLSAAAISGWKWRRWPPSAGLNVTVFESAGRLMPRTVSKPVSDFFAAEHQKAGVRLGLDTLVAGFEGQGKIEARARGRRLSSRRSGAGGDRRGAQ